MSRSASGSAVLSAISMLSRSSPGAARFAATRSDMYRANSVNAAPVSSFEKRLTFRNASDQCEKRSRSSAGAPSRSQMT